MFPYEKISEILVALGGPARVQIVLEIGRGEACVCHLEAVLGLRQAYISQQLMVLREKDLITARREGKYVFYSLRDAAILDLIEQAARLAGVEMQEAEGQVKCECPKCGEEDVGARGQAGKNTLPDPVPVWAEDDKGVQSIPVPVRGDQGEGWK